MISSVLYSVEEAGATGSAAFNSTFENTAFSTTFLSWLQTPMPT